MYGEGLSREGTGRKIKENWNSIKRKRTWLHIGLQNDISLQISRDIHQIEDQSRNTGGKKSWRSKVKGVKEVSVYFTVYPLLLSKMNFKWLLIKKRNIQ